MAPSIEYCRPGPALEQQARAVVRENYPHASSAYTRDGAMIYDTVSKEVLGRAPAGDWAVERAWQDAAARGTGQLPG